jgi:hypothetical protein
VTRRGIHLTLGLLWVLDGALQLQPYMFGRAFAEDIIAPAGEGQPAFVASGVQWAADLVVAHPVAWDLTFAVVQLAIGIGLLVPRTGVVRGAILASVAWALGVWYFGEGLGGLASGQVDLVTGAPGAVLLYAVLALAAWPTTTEGSGRRPAAWIAVPWAMLWVGAAIWQALPTQHGVATLAADVSGSEDGAPRWLSSLDRNVASHLLGVGNAAVGGLVAAFLVIGLWGLLSGTPRKVAAVAAIVVAVPAWLLGQSLGELYTGQSTDPNSAPLLVLFALALASAQPLKAGRGWVIG